MTFIPVPNGIQVELRFLLDEQRIENTLWFSSGSGTPADKLDDVASMVLAWWDASMQNGLSTQLTLNEVYASDMSSQDGAVYSLTTGLPITGADTDPAVPNQVALCISLRTANRGRTARGRNYIAGIPQPELVSNTFSSTAVNFFVSAYNTLIGIANTAGTPLCVCSRYVNNAPRVSGLLRPVTTALAIDSIADSQRRRTPGRGT